MLGNILVGLTVLFYAGLLNVTASPMPGGDRGVGYGLSLFVCGAGFVLFTGLLTWHMGVKNAFDWVPVAGGGRVPLLLAGWLSFSMATVVCASTKFQIGDFHPLLVGVLKRVDIMLPLLVLVPALLLLNMDRAAGTAPIWVKAPMSVGFAVSMVIGLALLFIWAKTSFEQQAAIVKQQQDRDEQRHSDNLTYIAEQTPDSAIVNILALTGRYHDQDVREAAVAKTKSRPNWEAELIALLDNEYYNKEVYSFIDGNKVDHPELFVEPIKRSILLQATEVRKSIKGSNNLQDWHFEHLSLPRLFRAIDEQFMLPGADYRPAVRELRRALDTPKPERFRDVNFSVTREVDAWLKAHP